MKVSIIIPIYNVEKYIIECLDSVYNQTYTNIEVILVDDCGTDNSIKIINNYLSEEKLAFTKIIHHYQNKGLSAARNTGINHATGDYIYFLDSDDYISNNCIESFVHLAEKYNIPDIIIGSTKQFPDNWTETCLSTIHLNTEFSNNINWIRKIFIKDNYIPITAWNKLVKKSFITQNDLYFKEGIINEDNLWNFKLGNKVKTISFNKEETYIYRYVPTSIINTKYSIKNMNSEVIITKEYMRNINYKYFFPQLVYILHSNHSAYCKRYGDNPLPPSYIRYPKAFLFFLKCLFMKPEHLRAI